MKIVVQAYQEYGKTIDKPKKYEFCCWKSLQKWLDSVTLVYACEDCQSSKTNKGVENK